ncbi:Protein bem46 [Diplonema papillatum]|nr:Protein bem46 [Diplonema papillatum]
MAQPSWGLIFAGWLVGVLLYLVRRYQYRLLYFPQFGFDEPEMMTPGHYGLSNWKSLNIVVNPKVKLLAYFLTWPPKGRVLDENHWKTVPTVIYFHGNAGNMGHRLPIMMRLQEAAQCNTVLVSYRGYRGSTSALPPSEEGLIEDAAAAIRHVLEMGVEPRNLFVLGTSLGGAVALGAALRVETPLRGLMVENTFTSIPVMTNVVLDDLVRKLGRAMRRRQARDPSTVVRYGCSTAIGAAWAVQKLWVVLKPAVVSLRWESDRRVSQLPHDQHVLFLSGARDELIPEAQMLQLFETCASSRKKFVSFPEGMHNDTCWLDDWYTKVAEWMRDVMKEQ